VDGDRQLGLHGLLEGDQGPLLFLQQHVIQHSLLGFCRLSGIGVLRSYEYGGSALVIKPQLIASRQD
jgi:hypothetical protein